MHKKIKIVLSALILLVLIGGGSYFLTKHKPSADTGATDNLRLLANLTVNNGGSSGTVIKLSDKFTDDQIGATLSGTVTRSMGGDAVLQEIRQKAKDLAKQPVEGQNTTRSAGQQKFVGDLVIGVRNSKGEPVKSVATRATEPVPVTAADNFDFDSSVTPEAKQFFIDSYSKIEKLIGFRENTRKIFITYDASLETGSVGGFFITNLNELHYSLKGGDFTGKDTTGREIIAHELTHAFYGTKQLPGLWNEGIASTIPQESGIVSQGIFFKGHADSEIENIARTYSNEDYMYGYTNGSRVMAKLYLENNNFFKLFNAELFKLSDVQVAHINSATLIEIVAKIVSQVENVPIYKWFSQQYGFIPSDFPPVENNKFIADFYLAKDENDQLIYGLTINSQVVVNIKAYTYNGSPVTDCDTVFTTGCQSNVPTGYKGWIKTVVTPDGNTNLAHTYYRNYPQSHYSYDYGIEGFIVGHNDAQSAIITNLETGWTASTSVTNGVFYFDSSTYLNEVKKTGRYKVDIQGPNGVLTTKYFNKTSGVYKIAIYNLPNSCQVMTLGSQAYPGGIHLASTTNKYCASTVFVNNVPVTRTYSQNYQTELQGLLPKVAYNLSFATADDYSVSKVRSAIVAPKDYFAITKQENIGIPSQRSFKRRLTFNYPINIDSFDSSFKDTDSDFIAFAIITKLNDLTYDFTPDKDLLDNHEYIFKHISGKSLDGFLLFNQVMNSINFTTPSAPAVKYTITSTVTTGGSITPAGVTNIISGQGQNYTITPNAGAKIADVKVDGKSVGTVATYAFTNVTTNHTISATFAIGFTITPLATTNGSISPNGTQAVVSGQNITFTAKPAANYNLDAWFVDGKMVKDVINAKDLTYTLNNITANHTILAIFTINTTVAPGSLKGQVLRGGKPVVGDTVTVKNLITNVIKNTTTDRTGNYSAGGLSVGKYNISATLRVCKKYFWFINICSNSTKTQPVTVVAGKIVTVPTIAF